MLQAGIILFLPIKKVLGGIEKWDASLQGLQFNLFFQYFFKQIEITIFRVSIQGVKSLLGDHVVFPRLGTEDTDRWRINKVHAPPVSVS